jgi:hypothetical protein
MATTEIIEESEKMAEIVPKPGNFDVFQTSIYASAIDERVQTSH